MVSVEGSQGRNNLLDYIMFYLGYVPAGMTAHASQPNPEPLSLNMLGIWAMFKNGL